MPRGFASVSDVGGAASTRVYKDFWLAPSTWTRIQPWMNVWDGYSDMMALAPAGTHPPSTGVDARMQVVGGLNSPVNGAYRDYLTINAATWVPGSIQPITADFLTKRRVLNCIWFNSGDRDTRYGEALYLSVINGSYDSQIRALIRSRPIGVNRPATGELYQFYDAFLHEADGYSPLNVNPTLYCDAVKHAMSVAIHEAQLMGATPYEYGCGGLLTGTGMDDTTKAWHWFNGLPQWMLDSDMVVGLWDTYFKVSTPTSPAPFFREKVDRHVALFEAAGIKRFVLAETALGLDTYRNPDIIVGTTQDLINFANECATWLREKGEGVSFFSKIDGPASKHGSFSRPGREPALQQVAWLCKEFNRPLRRV